jgi:hypothetical protein
LSAPLLNDETLLGSLDGGASWLDLGQSLAGTSLSWSGVTLVAANTLLLKVVDAAANEGPV